jgi:hypothetical protein
MDMPGFSEEVKPAYEDLTMAGAPQAASPAVAS